MLDEAKEALQALFKRKETEELGKSLSKNCVSRYYERVDILLDYCKLSTIKSTNDSLV